MKPSTLARVTESAKLDRHGSMGPGAARSSLTGINPLDTAMEAFKVCQTGTECGLQIPLELILD
jgi:hypothetical protein